MSRTAWLWAVVILTTLALAATFLVTPRFPVPVPEAGPPVTPFGWAGQLSLVAGDGVRGTQDGPGLQARFDDPWGIVVMEDGTRYVADAGDSNRIRRIARDGVVSTLAGGNEGFADGMGAAAAFHTPSALARDAHGNLYVADTGNHAIRKVTPAGVVTTIAGTGEAGFRDGPALQAQFNGPIGVAVDGRGRIYVADTYNDRIRLIDRDGQVTTLAGGDAPGFFDGSGSEARFDTPTGIAVDATGVVWVADLRNDAIRRIGPQGNVVTLPMQPDLPTQAGPRRPLSLALTHDGNLYVGELFTGRVMQVMRDGRWHALAGHLPGQRLSRTAGLAVDPAGRVQFTDAGSHRVHGIAPLPAGATPVAAIVGPSQDDPLPATAGRWPLQPQDGWHEVVGTLGEVRGDYQGESRHHLHGGLDIRGDVGATVLAIADGKVSSPSAAWNFDGLSEGLGVGPLDYIHMRVGRTPRGDLLDPTRFQLLHDLSGDPSRIRVRRGTRFAAGDALGTINRMAHVHLSIGPSGYERNAIALGFTGFTDTYPPRIDEVALFDTLDQPIDQRQDGRVLVPRELQGVRIVVDAWDQVDGNLPRRRLGLYAVGYQLLHDDGTPVAGFESPRMNLDFRRLPSDDAVQVAYAAGSGITVHGSAVTRFKYSVTNTVREGAWGEGTWQAGELSPGDYLLRITARDYSGNEAQGRRDLKLRLQ
ncbi:SMP-30/gluconolactonase/LRE family protein [Pseudoxanthomonas sp. PXM02]|uniref:SMP-30/gluconolactonase/LRE family protein n=1 Tax=Pseudoxanthomonas sp. PXM02 TaxID=2769294 RepID=UPI001785EDBA|nr:SMP-30/gluconolactonase/LRE family protein [Pseudoxanthomonas sp. PXM02]MBD9480867.1 SMP-30/gluconolactonase/LRE family protein [Pseudoxanthomonas sp. PXM02]